MTLKEAEAKLNQAGQGHVLRYYEELEPREQEKLLRQIEATNFEQIKTAAAAKVTKGTISPIEVMERQEIEERQEEFTRLGLQAIKEGKVAAVLLAGGMGTRLGSNDPKGMYDIGVTRSIPIFSRILKNLQNVVELSGTYIHLFVMTSEKNHEKTVAFFESNRCFGYEKEYVHFFKQEMAPATDFNGKVYLEEKGRIATSPNGNGGWFVSMQSSGMDEVIQKEGIQWLNVFAVDNVLQNIADPLLVGAAIEGNYSVGAKVIKKAAPDEKVGVICLEDGKPSIVEYYELTEQMLTEADGEGKLAYNYGVILNYLFRVEELITITKRRMPLHVVEKKIPCLDEEGLPVNPQMPNGRKYETLILDMIHLMGTALAFEVIREKEFAPIKNKIGIDSVESARQLLIDNGVAM